jgi:predicted dehydrogenase
MMPAMREAPERHAARARLARRSKARAIAAKFEAPRAYGGYDLLLADPEIDAVYIPLPNQLHCEWSIRALEPASTCCARSRCASRRAKVSACASLAIARASTSRKDSAIAITRSGPKSLELIASDAIGPVRAAHAVLAKQFLDPADVRNNPAAGGGALYDLGSYAINALNLVHGRPPRRVSGLAEHDPRFGIDRLTSACSTTAMLTPR